MHYNILVSKQDCDITVVLYTYMHCKWTDPVCAHIDLPGTHEVHFCNAAKSVIEEERERESSKL